MTTPPSTTSTPPPSITSASPAAAAAPLPLMIVCGWLGSGKTTFLRRLLYGSPRPSSPALAALEARGELLHLVNDFADWNVDATLFLDSQSNHGEKPQKQRSVVSLAGGCVCCNLLEPLLQQLLLYTSEGREGGGITDPGVEMPSSDNVSQQQSQLTPSTQQRQRQFLYAVLECTGLADAAPVVAALLVHPTLSQRVEIDCVVTVLDGLQYRLHKDPLQGSQLEGANAVLFTKEDLVVARDEGGPVVSSSTQPSSPTKEWDSFCERRLQVEAKVRESNPQAMVCSLRNGGEGLCFDDFLIGQKLFTQHDSRRWFLSRAKELLRGPMLMSSQAHESGQRAVAGETESLGAQSFTFVYRSTRRISLIRLMCALFPNRSSLKGTDPSSSSEQQQQQGVGMKKETRRKKSLFSAIWRSKGYFVARDDEHVDEADRLFTWSSVGRQFDYGPVLVPPPPSGSSCHESVGNVNPIHRLQQLLGGFQLPPENKETMKKSHIQHEARIHDKDHEKEEEAALLAVVVFIGQFDATELKAHITELFSHSSV